MTLEMPKIFKGAFTQFLDTRGYLNPIDFEELKKFMGAESFDLKFQLMSHSKCANTFRGLHYQSYPFSQNKLLMVHSGKIIDFLVPFDDPKSSKLEVFDLAAGDILFIPNTYAHGFLTTTPDVNLQYLLDHKFNEDHYHGINAVDYVMKYAKLDKMIFSEKDAQFSKCLCMDI